MTPPTGPILLSVGAFSVHWYGLLIVIGILLGTNVATYLAKESGEDPDVVLDMLLIAVLAGIVGARAYHVFSEPQGGLSGWSYYRENPWKIFYIWEGGLGIYGAIIGGLIGVVIFTRARRLNPWRWLDFAAPGMAIGQSIGRWGNYINQELYGPPTTLPWGLRIPPAQRIAPYNDLTRYPPDTLFHPTFLYESLATLALCLVLLWIAIRFKDRRKDGDLFILYLIGYSTIRFFIEYLRPDAWMVGRIAAAQLVALILISVGIIALVVRHRFSRELAETA